MAESQQFPLLYIYLNWSKTSSISLIFTVLFLNTHTTIIYKVSTTIAVFNTRNNVINNTNTVFIVDQFLNCFIDLFHRLPIGNSVEVFTLQAVRHHEQTEELLNLDNRHFVFHV